MYQCGEVKKSLNLTSGDVGSTLHYETYCVPLGRALCTKRNLNLISFSLYTPDDRNY